MKQTTTPNNAPNVLYMLSADDFKQVLKDFVLQVMEEQKQKEEEAQSEKLYTRAEALDILKIAPATLWKWQKSGYLVPFKIGRKANFRKSDIDRILKGKD